MLLGLLIVILHHADTSFSTVLALPKSKYELYNKAMDATLNRRFSVDTTDEVSRHELKQATEDLLLLLGSRNELYANGARIFNEDEVQSYFRERGGHMGSALVSVWNRLRQHHLGVPFVKVLSEGTSRVAAEFQFKHKSLQEAMTSSLLIKKSEILHNQISDDTDSNVADSSIAIQLNNPLLLNVFTIGGAELGLAMVKAHSSDWDFSKSGLNKPGFEALIHLCPKELGTGATLSVVGLR